MNKLKHLAHSAIALASMSPVLVFAQSDPLADAFDAVEAKMTLVGASALALAIVGALIWTGIGLFKKGVRAGGGKS